MARKFYVVWSGRQTGIFSDWPSAQRAVDRYPGACFKSFSTRAEAERAFRSPANLPPAASNEHEVTKRARGAGPGAPPFDVSIYCDGACDPNPGHAGSGIAVYRGGRLAELWFGLYHPRGTNNTAELNALLHALRMAETEITTGNTVEVCSDSAYSINCICRWAPNWEKRGWKKPDGEMVRNLEIIQDCYAIYRRIRKEAMLTHVAGHAGTEGNELADRMALLGVRKKARDLRRYEETIDIRALLRMRAV
jgi:ribonuclease HI